MCQTLLFWEFFLPFTSLVILSKWFKVGVWCFADFLLQTRQNNLSLRWICPSWSQLPWLFVFMCLCGSNRDIFSWIVDSYVYVNINKKIYTEQIIWIEKIYSICFVLLLKMSSVFMYIFEKHFKICVYENVALGKTMKRNIFSCKEQCKH